MDMRAELQWVFAVLDSSFSSRPAVAPRLRRIDVIPFLRPVDQSRRGKSKRVRSSKGMGEEDVQNRDASAYDLWGRGMFSVC